SYAYASSASKLYRTSSSGDCAAASPQKGFRNAANGRGRRTSPTGSACSSFSLLPSHPNRLCHSDCNAASSRRAQCVKFARNFSSSHSTNRPNRMYTTHLMNAEMPPCSDMNRVRFIIRDGERDEPPDRLEESSFFFWSSPWPPSLLSALSLS